MSAGKGDKPRPTKKSVYNQNFDLIVWNKDWKPKEEKKIKGKTIYKY